ncbi:MAG TPA: Hsp20/alpha crystallin family protein [Gemmatimonadales bacterium]|jgi:HSP20 family protein
MASISRYSDYPGGLFGLQRLNRLLDEAFTGVPYGGEQGSAITSAWYAPTDVSEDTNSLQITMEVPGVRPSDVKISLENNLLTVRGEKRQESEERNERVHRYERSYGTFERSFALPNTVDPENISAKYENGILRISIPKSERARPREIPVSGSSETTQVNTRNVADSSKARVSQRKSERDPEEEGSAGRSRL